MNNVVSELRVRVNELLLSTWGDHLPGLRQVREALSTANDLVGRPFCSREELARRGMQPVAAGAAEVVRDPAPVMVYFDGKDHRTLKKFQELLLSRDVPFETLDVTDDESTRSWALTAAKAAEFPLVFIAGETVGGLHELTQLDVNGELGRRVFG